MIPTIDKKVEVVVRVGSGMNEFVVNVIAWMERSGNVQVQLAPNKNGKNEELALRMLQRDPASVLKQVNVALSKAGYDIDQNVELVASKVMPGPDVPIHKNDPRLTPEFLATLVVVARSYGWGGDYVEVEAFVKGAFERAGIPVPDSASLEPFSPEVMDAAEQLDGKAPTVDGVMPDDNKDAIAQQLQ